MNKLDQILSISEKYEREEALIKYARSLGMDSKLAIDTETKELIEEKLALLIFDSQKTKKVIKKHDVRFFVIAISSAIVFLFLIFMLPRCIVSLYDDGSPKRAVPSGTYYTADGVYREYFKSGDLKYEFYFDKGKLKRKKTYNKKRKLLSDDKFN